jgi:hypothetical protein
LNELAPRLPREHGIQLCCQLTYWFPCCESIKSRVPRRPSERRHGSVRTSFLRAREQGLRPDRHAAPGHAAVAAAVPAAAIAAAAVPAAAIAAGAVLPATLTGGTGASVVATAGKIVLTTSGTTNTGEVQNIEFTTGHANDVFKFTTGDVELGDGVTLKSLDGKPLAMTSDTGATISTTGGAVALTGAAAASLTATTLDVTIEAVATTKKVILKAPSDGTVELTEGKLSAKTAKNLALTTDRKITLVTTGSATDGSQSMEFTTATGTDFFKFATGKVELGAGVLNSKTGVALAMTSDTGVSLTASGGTATLAAGATGQNVILTTNADAFVEITKGTLKSTDGTALAMTSNTGVSLTASGGTATLAAGATGQNVILTTNSDAFVEITQGKLSSAASTELALTGTVKASFTATTSDVTIEAKANSANVILKTHSTGTVVFNSAITGATTIAATTSITAPLFMVGADQVVGARGPPVADCTTPDPADPLAVRELQTQVNLLLLILRTHGLIAG